jgi:polar amino acid transport system permease protein
VLVSTTGTDARPPSSIELGRRAFRRQQTTRSVLLSIASTAVFAVLVWIFVVNTPGWAQVQETFFNLDVAVAAWPRVIEGFWLNVRVLFYSVIGVAVFAMLLATLRTLRGPVFFPLRAIAAGYTDLFRGLPLIIVLYVIGYGIPGLGIFPRMPAEFCGTLALVTTYSAYVSEVFRAGIESIHPSQLASADTLGLSRWQSMIHVILPQATRRVAPPLLNDFISLQKDTALLSVVFVFEAMFSAQDYTNYHFNYTPLVVAAVLFICLTIPLTRFTDWVARRMMRREFAGVVK